MLFTGLGRFFLWKTVPSVLSAASGRTRDLGHSFSQYGPLGWWITYIVCMCMGSPRMHPVMKLLAEKLEKVDVDIQKSTAWLFLKSYTGEPQHQSNL